jgi:glycosyltransferase involved in cell wall biosynthesis
MEFKDNIVFVGPIYDNSGYSYIIKNFVKRIHEKYNNVQCEPILSQIESSINEMNYFNSLKNNDIHNYNFIKIICWIPIFSIPKFKKNIIYTMSESRMVSPYYVQNINKYYDNCIVPNEYYKNAMIESGVEKPIHINRIGIDEIYNKNNILPINFNFKCFSKTKCKYNKPFGKVFISLFRWSYRKGFDVLIRSFLNTFNKNDDVSLLIVSRHAANGKSEKLNKVIENDISTLVNDYGDINSAPIFLLTDNIKNELMPSVYAIGDIFVLPSRGEGICLPPLEAAKMGLPTILPSHTGFSDYVCDDTSYVLNIDAWEKCNHVSGWRGLHGKKYEDQKINKYNSWGWITRGYVDQEFVRFGNQSIDELGYLMKKSLSNEEEGRLKNKNLISIIDEKYNWNSNRDVLISYLRGLE